MNFRLDRWLTLSFVAPFLRAAGGGDHAIPILMYHSIDKQDESDLHPYYRTATAPAAFASQMKHLKAEGYRSCDLAQAMRQLRTQEARHEKSVVITFDDGYSDFSRNAFPLLQEYGFTATVFLSTAYIGKAPISFKGKDCLTWPQVRELHDSGILFGSHTVTHPQLRDLSLPMIKDEVTISKQTIEDHLGCAVDSFAYPYAFPQTDTHFKSSLRDMLQQAGYSTGVCTAIGRAKPDSEQLFLERLPINSCDDDALLQAKLLGAYDWIATTQHISKTVKAGLRRGTASRKPNLPNEFPEVQRPC